MDHVALTFSSTDLAAVFEQIDVSQDDEDHRHDRVSQHVMFDTALPSHCLTAGEHVAACSGRAKPRLHPVPSLAVLGYTSITPEPLGGSLTFGPERC